MVADNTWSAKKGMEALLPKFHEGKTVGLNSQKVKKDLNYEFIYPSYKEGLV